MAIHDADLFRRLSSLLEFCAGGTIGGKGGLAAYLTYMAARLLACRRVLKESGSLYLHCDPTAGHYLKLLLDAIFGSETMRREIIWQCGSVSGFKSRANNFVRDHDTILYFRMSDKSVFNRELRPYSKEYVDKMFRKTDSDGRKFRDRGYRKFYADEGGTPIGSVWTNILSYQTRTRSSEYLGYPTQKPLALLERIIRASSNPGDLVLDPFCGCGTAVEAAQTLGRRWIGIDVEPLAVDLMARRLRERCGVNPRIRGIPYDFAQARRLAENAPYEFERWALRLVPGAQPNFKQTGDGGLDGRAVVDVAQRPQPLYGFQVKGGQHVGRPAADAFSGALTQHGCAAGLMIVLNERSAEQLRGALGAQQRVQLNGWSGPRISVWSVESWFASGLQCTASRPSLLGEYETLELLRPQDWQRGLEI